MKTRASKIGSVLLTLSLIIGMFAGMGLTAWADDATSVTVNAATTAPVTGATPATGATTDVTLGTAGTLGAHTVAIAWSPNDVTFAASTAYTATFTITLTGGSDIFDASIVASDITCAGSTSISIVSGEGTDTLVFDVEWPITESDDATLSALAISAGTLTPAFSSSQETYTASVANSVLNIDVTPTVNDANATVTVNGVAATSTVASTVALNVGANPIPVVVTAESGATKTYTITVTRAGPVCEINVIPFPTFAAALAAVQDGDTITLLANITETVDITLNNKSITIDLFGNNLTVTGNVTLTGTAGLTVTDTGPTTGSAGPGTLKIIGAIDIPDLTLNGGALDLRDATGTIGELKLGGGTLLYVNKAPTNPSMNAQEYGEYIKGALLPVVISNVNHMFLIGDLTLVGYGTITRESSSDFWTYKAFPDDYVPPERRTTTSTRSNSSNLETYALFYYKNPTNDFFIYCQDGYQKGDKVKITSNIPTRSGYVFLYWTTDPGGDGTRYNAGDIFYLYGNAELYAQWGPKATDREPYDDDGDSFNPSTGR